MLETKPSGPRMKPSSASQPQTSVLQVHGSLACPVVVCAIQGVGVSSARRRVVLFVAGWSHFSAPSPRGYMSATDIQSESRSAHVAHVILLS